jgi:hypothetical protein
MCARTVWWMSVPRAGREWSEAQRRAPGSGNSYTQLREALLGSGQLDAKDLDACLALFDDPNFVFMGPTIVATWGRRPAL